ncbi:LuxR C-terminal-related transcriptional regulator [Paenarthrobacter sp. NPDC089675]|uniref:LuxR C-terminal-related transcriptional regulator n=1 Tax=Paenarthrobacter sp. NPDC089675 TaxID=3364376 RepID=UPI0037FECE56
MHNENVDRVLGYVAKGLGVRIVGAPGSGRTSLAKSLVAKLEDEGVDVYAMFAAPALASVPFAGILSLGLDLRSRTIGILGIADLLSAQLARTDTPLIVIDDVENLDRESLAVANILRTRANVPLVITMNDKPFQPKTPAGLLASLPEATIALNPLGYEQINKLIIDVLGAPADVDVVAHVLNKSGGNLRLAVRILETAVLSERLVFKDSRWCMGGGGLMNEHLHGSVEALLHGLRSDEVRALNKLSLLGPTPVGGFLASVGEDVLDNLEVSGLISVVNGQDGAPVATVFPPIVDDYLKTHAAGSRRVLRSALTGHVDAPALDAPTPDATDDLLSAAVSALQTEMSSNHAATTRYFQQRLETLERQHLQAWESDKSLSNAVSVLALYWGAPADPQRVQEIFRLTRTQEDAPADLFFFTMTLAWWKYSAENDLPAAVATMESMASREPSLRPEAEAFVEFLKASSGQATAAAATTPVNSSMHAIIRGMLALYRLKPDEAVKDLDADAVPGHLQRFESFLRGMAMFSSGRVEEALVSSLDSRQQALHDLDQFSFVAQSYIAALSLLHHGLFDEAEYLMGRAFSLGKPGLPVAALHGSMMHLSSLRDVGARAALEANATPSDVGPLPAMGTELLELAASRPVSAKAFDELACRIVDRFLAHGFELVAMHTAIFALGLLPGPRVRNLLTRILTERGITAHNQLLDIADAAIQCELSRLQHLLDTYVLDGDTYQISMVLRGAEQRWQLSGEPAAAAEIRRAAKEFMARFQPIGTLLNFRSEPPGSSLTLREIEVALVAGQQSNQDIAEQFGISIRTVESHISNALRKTDTTTRKQLADLIHSAPRALLSGAMGSFHSHHQNTLDSV